MPSSMRRSGGPCAFVQQGTMPVLSTIRRLFPRRSLSVRLGSPAGGRRAAYRPLGCRWSRPFSGVMICMRPILPLTVRKSSAELPVSVLSLQYRIATAPLACTRPWTAPRWRRRLPVERWPLCCRVMPGIKRCPAGPRPIAGCQRDFAGDPEGCRSSPFPWGPWDPICRTSCCIVRPDKRRAGLGHLCSRDQA